MTTKCAKCIEHFKVQKRQLELIRDLKVKNEGRFPQESFLVGWIEILYTHKNELFKDARASVGKDVLAWD